MEILKDYDLTNLNTLRIKAKARFFAEAKNLADLLLLFTTPEFQHNKKFILGGGSNVLFTQDFDGLVIKVSLLGKKIIEENENSIVLEVAAGENWHDLVTYAVDNNWGGIENLALIPGLVGAAPVQNIAAYGENFSDVFVSLDAFNMNTGKVETFTKDECNFGYRTSIFKKENKDQYIILSVRIKLSKVPKIEDSYYQIGITRGGIKEELAKMNLPEPYTVKNVYDAVINIRTRKLPDPSVTPTAGSFFLNSIISRTKYEELKKSDAELQCYPPDQTQYKDLNDPSLVNEDRVKVATGRLLQNLGWLGKWEGNVGMHDRHALVLVTNGHATGAEVVAFAKKIQDSYLEKYGIVLESEVNFV